jgi:GH24 family phage-related lysozyme (muramidase)
LIDLAFEVEKSATLPEGAFGRKAMNDTMSAAALGTSEGQSEAFEALLAYREQQEVELEELGATPEVSVLAAAPSQAAIEAARRVSAAAFKMIVDYETGGRAFYDNVIKQRPIWPKGSSGITIGFGYDLGYVSLGEYERDWATLIAGLSASQRSALAACVGFHSGKDSPAKLQALLQTVRDIVVSWEVSQIEFEAQTLPKFALLTQNALPNTDRLSGDCFGALVSLTFNRGASYSKPVNPANPKDRYFEMREIKKAMQGQDFARIPVLLKDMIRVWEGTQIEGGMKRRRNDEAALFLAGLAAGPEVSAEMSILEAGVAAAEAALPPEAESTTGKTDEDFWTETGEDELAAAAAEGFMIGVAAAGASWAADAVQPDYAHLGSLDQGVPFELTADDLALLARLNDFDVGVLGEDTPILFGLRGAGVVKDHTSGGVVLMDQRPDHVVPRCTIGVWHRREGKVSVFPGSTVPNQAAVAKFKADGSAGNLLATGLYHYVCGPHITSRTTPGCFLLRNPDMSKRVVVVRRSKDDLSYQKTDVVDRCAPGDNIHPAFFSNGSGFSSLGCQTVTGTFKEGVHSGPWAAFRKAAGLTDTDGEPGKRYLYMLLTGAEARIASRLRADGLAADPIAARRLRRIRFGSSSEAAKRLQAKLNLADPDGAMGPLSTETLHRAQAGIAGAQGSDGIYTPDMDAALGWQVFGALGI